MKLAILCFASIQRSHLTLPPPHVPRPTLTPICGLATCVHETVRALFKKCWWPVNRLSCFLGVFSFYDFDFLSEWTLLFVILVYSHSSILRKICSKFVWSLWILVFLFWQELAVIILFLKFFFSKLLKTFSSLFFFPQSFFFVFYFYATSCLLDPALLKFWNSLPIPFVIIFIAQLYNIPFPLFLSLSDFSYIYIFRFCMFALLSFSFAFHDTFHWCFSLLATIHRNCSSFCGSQGKK